MANEYLKEGRLPTEKKDCTVIALSYACDLDYNKAHEICKKNGRIDGKGFTLSKVFRDPISNRLLNEMEFRQFELDGKKFVVTLYPRPKMSVGKFKIKNPTGIFLIRVGGHVFCMKDGVVFNQSNDNDKISYYHKVVKI